MTVLRRISAIAVSLSLVLSLVPTAALAEVVDEVVNDDEEVASVLDEESVASEGDGQSLTEETIADDGLAPEAVVDDEATSEEGEDVPEVVLTVSEVPSGDVDGPEVDLSSLAISQAQATAGESVTFTCSASDASGVATISLYLKHVGSGKEETVMFRSQGDGTWSGSFAVDDATPSGDWRPVLILTRDAKNNYSRYADPRGDWGSVYPRADLSAWDFVAVPANYSLITYLDGCDGIVFNEVHYLAADGDATPAFEGPLVRDGYLFDGWTPELADTVAESVTYTATWVPDTRPTYTVTFKDGCDGAAFADIVVNVREGDAVVEPTDLFAYREGYDFVGWDRELASEAHGDLTYTAQWAPNADFVVAVDQGPIRISVNNPSIGTVYNGITWKTTNVSLGYIGSTGLEMSGATGMTAWADFHPSEVGFAILYATDSNGTRTLGSCSVLVTPASEPVLPEGWHDFDDGAKGYVRDGELVKGWMDLGGAKYWFDDQGRMATGWTDLVIDGKEMHYYFRPSGNLARGSWADIDGKKYYFRPSGNMATGWATIADETGAEKKYYFDESGQMLTGWQDIVNDLGATNHYYFRPSGSMATGWAEIDGSYFYFRPSGNMATGFTDVTDDAYKRYFDESGRMLTGWQEINGNTYYFRASGAMQTGTATIDGKTYTFSDKGVLVS